MAVAALLAFVIAPSMFFLALKFDFSKSALIDPLVDMFTVLIIVGFLPELWHPALLLGVVIALAPSMSVAEKAYRFYSALIAILIVGMTGIAVFYQLDNWQLPILALVAVYPSVVLYAYGKSLHDQEIRAKADALSALQVLSGGVAHDFNNILTGISGYAEFAKSYDFEQRATERALDKIIDSAERASLLTRQLMSFSEVQKNQLVAVDIGREVRAVADMLNPGLDSDIKIKLDIPPDAVVAKGDPVQLHQVLLNLMLNAVEASKNSGVIRVKVEASNDKVQIEVSDDGEGIPSSVKDSLFQPFVTSKAKGHGLGLAVVKNIVEEHQGTVDVVSNVGIGARFIVRLPIASEPQSEPSEALSAANTILLADDEKPIRVILRQVLEMDGYTVIEAEDGNRFLELFEAQQEEICAVVLDIKMPGRTGWQCLDEVRRVSPNLPALIISGYDPEGPNIERPDHAMKFIAKPFRIAEVKKAIQELTSLDVDSSGQVSAGAR
jgi:signal transduction histidine kinase/ActR/RegA family two-component response regulator